MKLDRLFKFGKQGYNMYRSYKNKGRGTSSHGTSSHSASSYSSSAKSGGTLERLVRRFLK